jgi:hypothetical protein
MPRVLMPTSDEAQALAAEYVLWACSNGLTPPFVLVGLDLYWNGFREPNWNDVTDVLAAHWRKMLSPAKRQKAA